MVDDGSTDSSYQICQKYELFDFKVHLIHKVNGAHMSARKMGIDLACVEYISFVDGDDCLDTDMHEKLIGFCDNGYPDIISYGMIVERLKSKKYIQQHRTLNFAHLLH